MDYGAYLGPLVAPRPRQYAQPEWIPSKTSTLAFEVSAGSTFGWEADMNLSETQEVLTAISSLEEGAQRMALATIVSVRGSTYRRPGARFLVGENGVTVGNLSGGCLEGEVEELAKDVMVTGRPRLALYDLTADDEVVWGWGLGCNGAIEVFVEPGDKAAEVAGALRGAIEEQRRVAVATVLDSSLPGVQPGARMLLHANGAREGGIGARDADEALAAALSEALSSTGTGVRTIPTTSGDLRAFVEVLEPPLRLLVCGAGHDAIPLVRLGSSLGWSVVVVDDREAFLTHDRFPDAAGFVLTEPARAAGAAGTDGRSYVVVMSHNYLRDRDYLRSFIATDVAYIGMLGPRARLQRLLEDLARDGIEPLDHDVAKIHGPAGLDVGGEGPEEIAAAIVSEILAVSRKRGAGFLKDRRGPIHERAAARA